MDKHTDTDRYSHTQAESNPDTKHTHTHTYTDDLYIISSCLSLQGSGAVGQYLATHPDIAKVTFTGSVPTGSKVMAACATVSATVFNTLFLFSNQ